MILMFKTLREENPRAFKWSMAYFALLAVCYFGWQVFGPPPAATYESLGRCMAHAYSLPLHERSQPVLDCLSEFCENGSYFTKFRQCERP